jgi:hypothetical protein
MPEGFDDVPFHKCIDAGFRNQLNVTKRRSIPHSTIDNSVIDIG